MYTHILFWFQNVFIKVHFFHMYSFPKVGSITNLRSSYAKVGLTLQNV